MAAAMSRQPLRLPRQSAPPSAPQSHSIAAPSARAYPPTPKPSPLVARSPRSAPQRTNTALSMRNALRGEGRSLFAIVCTHSADSGVLWRSQEHRSADEERLQEW